MALGWPLIWEQDLTGRLEALSMWLGSPGLPCKVVWLRCFIRGTPDVGISMAFFLSRLGSPKKDFLIFYQWNKGWLPASWKFEYKNRSGGHIPNVNVLSEEKKATAAVFSIFHHPKQCPVLRGLGESGTACKSREGMGRLNASGADFHPFLHFGSTSPLFQR